MKLKNLFKSILAISIAATMTASFTACVKTPEPTPEPDEPIVVPQPDLTKVTITAKADKTEVRTGDSVNLTATVAGADDKTFKWEYDKNQVVVTNNVLTVLHEGKIDTSITVTAVATANPDKTASVVLSYKAPISQGTVGDLTSDLIQEIGNASITVTGVVKDIYHDNKQASNNSTTEYEFSVAMSDSAWSGSWNAKGNANVLTDVYRKGEEMVTNANGVTGHALKQMYIDKDNKVASKTVKDYVSKPAVWEEQHYWNHLGNLDVNSFTFDTKNGDYYHKVTTDETDLYLMTYLAYSLTPLLEDTFSVVRLKVENGHVTKLTAQTEVVYIGQTDSSKPDTAAAFEYTEVEIAFSQIGTTTVADPAPYAAPQNADKLTAALTKMAGAKNYTYIAKDATVSAPSLGDDYSLEKGTPSLQAPDSTTFRVGDNTSETGTVGSVGLVTEQAIFVSKTSKYSATMDGKDFRTVYSGYRQFDGYYEEFAYNKTLNNKEGGYEGTKYVKGNMFAKMPKFSFSANIFAFIGTDITDQGTTVYKYKLRETSIMRDIALELSAYSYAKNAAATSRGALTLTVDENGNLISSLYPYSIVGGTYTGNVTTTYTKVGTTTIPEDTFDGYVARQIKNNWSDYQINYRPTHSTLVPDNYVAGDTVLTNLFGDFASYIPQMKVFIDLFGDNISGPWADWKENGKDADGNTKFKDYVQINTQSTEFDENTQITNWTELVDKIGTAFTAEGYKLSQANTDIEGKRSASKNRYLTFTKTNDDGDGVMIVFENTGTCWIYISIYKVGEWKLSTRA